MAGNIKNAILIEPYLNTDDGSDTLGDYDTLDKTFWPYDPTDTSGSYRFSNVLQTAINNVNSLKPVRIRVCEGTSAATATDQVRINNAGLHLFFEPGFELRLSDSLTTSAFLVEAPLYCEGLRAYLDVGSTTANRSLFKFRTNADTVAVSSNAHTSGLGKFIRATGSFSTDLYGTGTLITSSGFTASGANGNFIVLSVTTTTNPNDTLIVRDPADGIGTESAGGSRQVVRKDTFAGSHFYRCLFSMCQTNAAVPGFFAIDMLGSDATYQVPAIDIDRCRFEIRNWTLSGTDAVQSTNSWTGGEYSGTPYGVGCMKLSNLRAYSVTNNKYYAHSADYQTDVPTIQKNYGGIFLYRDGCMQGIIHSNIVDGVCLAASTGKEALPLNISLHTTGNEGGHSLTSGLQVENVVCKHIHYSNTPWDKHRDIQAGRIFPGYTTSAIRLVGGRSSDVEGLTTHNFNGPSTSGNFALSSSTGKVTGTSVEAGIKVDDWVALSNFSANADGIYLVTAVGTNELTLAGVLLDVANGAAVSCSTGAGSAGTATFTRASGSWITDGFSVGVSATSAGFATSAYNSSWTVSAVSALVLTVTDSTDIITTTEAGGTVTRTATVKQQFWAIDADTHNVAKFGSGNHAFRKSAAPPYRIKTCQGVVLDQNEPVDGFQTIP